MKYGSAAFLRPSASLTRLLELVDELKSLGCQVQIDRSGLDRERWRLEFTVPEDDYAWIRTGGLGVLFSSYADIISWSPHFTELSEEVDAWVATRQLPAPLRPQEAHRGKGRRRKRAFSPKVRPSAPLEALSKWREAFLSEVPKSGLLKG